MSGITKTMSVAGHSRDLLSYDAAMGFFAALFGSRRAPDEWNRAVEIALSHRDSAVPLEGRIREEIPDLTEREVRRLSNFCRRIERAAAHLAKLVRRREASPVAAQRELLRRFKKLERATAAKAMVAAIHHHAPR